MAKPLTAKQEAFCLEYLKDLNATQAAIRAGYSAKTAKEGGYENLTKPHVADKIAELMEKRNEKVEIDATWVLNQAVKLHERCMQEVAPILDREGENVKDEDGNNIYKFDSVGAKGSLELIGKHVDVAAFKERVEHSGSIETMSDDELNAKLSELVNATAKS